MAVDRPTFHEAWYRVSGLRPRLLSGVRAHRQHFRGRTWYVLENRASDQYSRISEEAYRFVGLLNGRRTVADVWQICNEQLGDRAPTQGEIIQLLGQLHAANVLYAELAADSEALFNRYRKRVTREVQNYLMNLLFLRIPLLDPDRFLDRCVGLFGRFFSWPGFVLWLALLGAGLYFVIGDIPELISQSEDVLDPGNLFWLYLSFVVVKVVHEFSHAFACKRFGRLHGTGGEVHKMGVMFLVLFPLPYVDASSAWAFRRKWHRAIVGMAGVMAELAIAAVAALVWAHTSTGTAHIIAYNVIFVASVSTVLFNGNPLLRFDAYYVLTDLIEIPNLAQRYRQYFSYLVRHYAWGLKRIWNPAYTVGERLWFVGYGSTSSVYRLYISIRILLFLNSRLPEELFLLVPILAVSGIAAWLVVPVGRFLYYLATSEELTRNRPRALALTAATVLVLAVGLGVLRLPDHRRIEGIVEPQGLSIIHAESDGFVTDFLASQTAVTPEAPVLVTAVNPALEAEQRSLLAERRALEVRRRQALLEEVAAAQILDEQLAALDEKIARVRQRLAVLHAGAPIHGTWVAPEIEFAKGRFLRRGETLGVVADLQDLLVRATAGQNVAALLIEQAAQEVEIRASGRPDPTVTGTIERIFPAGQEQLPSQALGYAVGGSMPVDVRDPSGTKTAEKFFEIRIRPRFETPEQWRTGQRVIVRARLRPKSLAAQVYHYGRQLFQRRFHI
ncbi:MAG: efflux RND transporter periplasmic adaptor subunit [Planctomycetes bacterium]|jgi:putative peptide zinc metalloprotease protein|nr:efflux RND transporter periplasmic adaptor subunit [Planctomycetota bacterium]